MKSVLMILGFVVMAQGDHPAARSILEEGLALYTVISDKEGMVTSLLNLAGVALSEQDYQRARTLLDKSLTLTAETGDKKGLAEGLAQLGAAAIGEGQACRAAAIGEGQACRAAKLLGASEILYEAMGLVRELAIHESYEQATTKARSQLGEKLFEHLRQEGRALTLDEAISYALEEPSHD